MKNKSILFVASCFMLGLYSFLKISSFDMAKKEAYKGSHLFELHSSGAPSGKTGAPGETNCTACHSGTVNDGTSVNTLTLFEEGTTTPVSQYEIGKTYDAVVTVAGASSKKGFQSTARALSTNLTSGSFTAVSNSTAVLNAGTKQYINHVTAALSSSNFSFKWTAPSSDNGDVCFYIASNVTNANNNNQGDQIFLSQHTFSRKLIPPVADFTSNGSTICSGSTIDFTSTSTGNPTSYSWVFQGGNPATSTDPNPLVQFPTAGSFDVSLTVTNGDGSNEVVKTSFITVNQSPEFSLGSSASPSTCGAADGTILINGSQTGIISWSGPVSGSSASTTLPFQISGLSAGNYTITFDNGSGCISSELSTSIADPGAPAQPTVSSSDTDLTICAGESITLTSSVSTGNLWSTGESTQAIVVNSASIYSVSVISGGCTGPSSIPLAVTVNPVPNTPLISSSDADNIICSGSETLTLTSSAASSYLWSTGETSQQITVSTSGIFSVSVSENNCNSPVSASVTVSAQNCASVLEQKKDLLLLYPNPTSNFLLLSGQDLKLFSTLICYDAQGKVVRNWALNQQAEHKIDLSGIEAGKYLFVLQSPNKATSEHNIEIIR